MFSQFVTVYGRGGQPLARHCA